jgi:hypothetical protein
MSDPYNPFEREYKLTRGALELIDTYGFGISIATKSDLVTIPTDAIHPTRTGLNAYLKMNVKGLGCCLKWTIL